MKTPEQEPLEQVERYLSGQLDDEGAGELLRELSQNPDFGKRALRIIHVDHLLRDHYGIERENKQESKFSSPNVQVATDFDSLLHLEKTATKTEEPLLSVLVDNPLPEAFSASSTVPYSQRRAAKFWSWSTILLFVALTLAVYREWFPSRTVHDADFAAVARIVEAVDAEWEETGETYKKGRELEPSSLRLKSGVVKLEFADGAEVVLEGPTDFLVRDKNGAFCQQGRLSVFVPPRAVGFEIDTPIAKVVDQGTAFSLRVSDGESEVHVLEGKVEVKPPRKEKVQLIKGFASLLDLRSEPKTVPADASTFLNDDDLRQRKQAYVEKRGAIWREQRSRLESDPGLVYRLEPETVSGLRRSPGSRDDKKAVAFRKSTDRIDIAPGTECRNLTLIASVRLESMRHVSNTLLIGDDFYTQTGQFVWQFDRSGKIQFHVNYGEDGRFRQFDSPPCLGRKDWKIWITPALVADGRAKTITHYLDGRVVGSVPWDDPRALRIDRMSLGNEKPGRKKPIVRFFNGDVDEFLIFNRALSGEEIKAFYHDGL